jgi:hypothetical protein
MSIDPPAPRAGHAVTVSLRLETRIRPITDPATLDALSFVADMTVDGQTIPVRLNDNGIAPDTTAGDGIYAGSVLLPPDATGAVTFTGSVAGVGISGDTRTVDAQVASGPPLLTAVSSLTGEGSTVAPGGSLSGDVTVANQTGRSQQVRHLGHHSRRRDRVHGRAHWRRHFSVPPRLRHRHRARREHGHVGGGGGRQPEHGDPPA